MDNSNKSFEEQLHDKLKYHEVLPPPGTWNLIDKEQKKKRFFWLFRNSLNLLMAFDIAFLGVLSGLVLTLLNPIGESINAKPQLVIGSSNINHYNNKNEKNATVSELNNTHVHTEKTEYVSESKTINKPVVYEEKNIANAKSKPVTASLISKQFEKKKAKNSNIIEVKNSFNNDKPIAVTEPILWAALAPKSLMIGNEIISNFDYQLAGNNYQLIEIAPSVIKEKSKKEIAREKEMAAKTQTSDVVLSNNTNAPNAVDVSLVSNGNQQTTDALATSGNQDSEALAMDTVYGNKKKCQIYFAVDAVFSPDYAWREITGNPANDYFAKRDSSEKLQFAFSAALRLNCFLTDNIYIQTGINYSQRKETFSLNKNTYANEDYIDSTHFITHVDPFEPPVIIKQYDTLTYVRKTVSTIQTNMTYKSYNIPMSVGYRFKGKKFGIAIQGGAEWNLLFSQKGTYINPDTEALASDNTQLFKTKLGWSLIASIAVDYKIADKWSLLIEPNTRYILKSVNQSYSPVQSKFYTIGLYVGLRYKF